VLYVALIYYDVTIISIMGICIQFINFRGVAIHNVFLGKGDITSKWEIQSSCNGTESTILNCKLRVLRRTARCPLNQGVICGEPGITYVSFESIFIDHFN